MEHYRRFRLIDAFFILGSGLTFLTDQATGEGPPRFCAPRLSNRKCQCNDDHRGGGGGRAGGSCSLQKGEVADLNADPGYLIFHACLTGLLGRIFFLAVQFMTRVFASVCVCVCVCEQYKSNVDCAHHGNKEVSEQPERKLRGRVQCAMYNVQLYMHTFSFLLRAISLRLDLLLILLHTNLVGNPSFFFPS